VPIHEIVPNPEQPRRHFDDEALGQLADSIRRHGLLQPLVARRIAGRYELIAGERRLRAAVRAGLERLPVIVREARAEDRLELALIENVQRENLTALEEAEAYRQLLDQHGLTQDELAERVGKSRPAITNTLRLLGLPDAVKAQLESGELTAGHARAVLAIAGVTEQVSFAREIVTARLTKSEAERLAAARRDGPAKPPAAIVVGYAAVGAAVILGRSLRDAARTTPAPNAVTAMTTGALTAAAMSGTTKSRTGLARASVGGAAVVLGRRGMASAGCHGEVKFASRGRRGGWPAQ